MQMFFVKALVGSGWSLEGMRVVDMGTAFSSTPVMQNHGGGQAFPGGGPEGQTAFLGAECKWWQCAENPTIAFSP